MSTRTLWDILSRKDKKGARTSVKARGKVVMRTSFFVGNVILRLQMHEYRLLWGLTYINDAYVGLLEPQGKREILVCQGWARSFRRLFPKASAQPCPCDHVNTGMRYVM